jgi:BlaI family penicillinase repressor
MDIVLHDREADVMEVLWERGSATAAEVRDAITDSLAYTTVLTILRRLEQKQYVGHTEEGRAHRYHPLVARDQARRSALRQVIDRLFGGSNEHALTHLVSDNQLSAAEIERLRELLRNHRPPGDS